MSDTTRRNVRARESEHFHRVAGEPTRSLASCLARRGAR